MLFSQEGLWAWRRHGGVVPHTSSSICHSLTALSNIEPLQIVSERRDNEMADLSSRCGLSTGAPGPRSCTPRARSLLQPPHPSLALSLPPCFCYAFFHRRPYFFSPIHSFAGLSTSPRSPLNLYLSPRDRGRGKQGFRSLAQVTGCEKGRRARG